MWLILALSIWSLCFASGYVSGIVPGTGAHSTSGSTTRKQSSMVMEADSYRPPLIVRGKASRSLLQDREKSSLLSKLTFSWVQPMMELGNRKTLEVEDLWRLEERDLMANVSATFDAYFEQAKADANITAGQGLPPLSGNNVVAQFWSSPLTKAVVHMYRKELVLSGITKFFNTFVQFLPSLIVARILANLDKQALAGGASVSVAAVKVLRTRGVGLAVLLAAVLSIKTFLENQYVFCSVLFFFPFLVCDVSVFSLIHVLMPACILWHDMTSNHHSPPSIDHQST
jgi:hypothetical protein